MKSENTPVLSAAEQLLDNSNETNIERDLSFHLVRVVELAPGIEHLVKTRLLGLFDIDDCNSLFAIGHANDIVAIRAQHLGDGFAATGIIINN